MIAIVILILWLVGFFALQGVGVLSTYTSRNCHNLCSYFGC